MLKFWLNNKADLKELQISCDFPIWSGLL